MPYQTLYSVVVGRKLYTVTGDEWVEDLAYHDVFEDREEAERKREYLISLGYSPIAVTIRNLRVIPKEN